MNLTKIRLKNLQGLYDRVLNSEECLNYFEEIDEIKVNLSFSNQIILFFEIYLKKKSENLQQIVAKIVSLLEETNFHNTTQNKNVEIPIIFFNEKNEMIEKIIL